MSMSKLFGEDSAVDLHDPSKFFSDGLSEELLNLLTMIAEMQVASRTSAFSFKGEAVEWLRRAFEIPDDPCGV